jgi:hypothetical protein
MTCYCVRMVGVVSLLAALTAGAAFAQGSSTASISGVVVDSDGGVVPGASVVVTNTATGETFPTVTKEGGAFNVPSLITGTYTVTVSLEGFKTVVISNVVINSGVPASVRATLEVGGLAETVTVQSNAELVQTQTAAVSTTLDTREIMNLPLSSRSAFDFVSFLPGVQTAAGNRESIVNGLPQATLNITLDGVNIQDNTLKTTDGFFAIVGPRLDAVEELTLSTAAGGSDSVGMGASQIRFVTRSGTNSFRGTAYHTYRSDELNANTWLNKRDGIEKAELLRNQPGFSVGGPIVIPGLYDGHNKAFFFVNYEELRQPGATRRTRTILHPLAQQGIFRYNTAQGVREVNLLQLAAANGQLATIDPIVGALLRDMRTATGTSGAVRDLTDPLFQEYNYQNATQQMSRYPTFRLDYQLTNAHRMTFSMSNQYIGGGPDTTNNRDPFFPGFPVTANQSSTRRQASGWLRSMFGANMVNEFRVGYGGAPVVFARDQFSPELWNGSVANQGGFYLNFNNPTFIAPAGGAATPSARDAYTRSFENTLNWQKGSHSINTGAAYAQFDLWQDQQQLVPELRFDVLQGDPAESLFVGANFPGASATNLTNARRQYAILTGRVSQVLGIARLNEDTEQYEYLGLGTQRAVQRQVSFWAQDSWRMRSNMVINAGVRYEMQFPFVAKNNSYSTGDIEDVYGVSGVGNLFQPGVLTGRVPQFRQLGEGEKPYPMDWNNVAPSVGVAWTPSAGGGFMRKVTGDTGDLAVRAGYTMAFTRLGLNSFTGEVGNNPGVSLNVNRLQTLGNLGTLPVLLREPSRLGPANFPQTPSFPFQDVVTGDITIFSPNLQVPRADTWQVGVTRALGRTMSVEARYVGSRSNGNWRRNNYNELNIVENGFLDEFRLAMANLQSNIAAGRGPNFRYYGPGTGTAPLPIFLAYFSGISRDRAADPSLYTSAQFANSTYVNPLARFNPNPYGAADALDADAASQQRALAAGLPANFLLANPHLLGVDGADLRGANIVENTLNTQYHSVAFEFRRRMSNGLQFDSSYAYGNANELRFYSLRPGFNRMVRDAGEEGDVTHAFKMNAVYELPFGRGKKFGNGVNAFVNGFIGDWQLAGTARWQSGRLVDLGNVRLVGMSKEELEDMYRIRIDAQQRVWMFPEEIVRESVKAFSASGTSASGWGPEGAPSGRYIAPPDSFECIERVRGGGECGLGNVVLTGPSFKFVDFSVVKRVGLWGRLRAEVRLDVLNAFNTVNFEPVSGMRAMTAENNFLNGVGDQRSNGSNPDFYSVTELVGANEARVFQIASRISW